MSRFKPVREHNAIDEIAFVVIFNPPLDDSAIIALDQIKGEFKKDLPNHDPLSVVEVSLDQNHRPRIPTSKNGGFVCSEASTRDPSRHKWSLKVDSKGLTVGCSEYTAWKEIWEKAQNILSTAISALDTDKHQIIEIVYQCLDKFEFEGDQAEHDINLLFSEESQYLTPFIRSSSPIAWHCYQGWFEELTNDNLALHNLNLSANNVGDSHYTSVSHIVRVMRAGRDAFPKSSELSDIDNIANAMDQTHELNKSLIRDLLCKDMLKIVGL